MKIGKLISELKKFDPEKEVCIFDWRKSIHNSSDEPNGIVIEDDFKVEIIKNYNSSFVALSFMNDDYTNDGDPNYASLLAASILLES